MGKGEQRRANVVEKTNVMDVRRCHSVANVNCHVTCLLLFTLNSPYSHLPSSIPLSLSPTTKTSFPFPACLSTGVSWL